MRRFGLPPEPGRKYTARPGAYGILARGNDLLVTCQEDPEFEYQLPGGGIDPGEHPILALKRECLEETGWIIGAPRRLGAYRRFTYMPDYDLWAEKICHIFVAMPIRRHGAPSEDGHQALWMTGESAAKMLDVAGDRHFVRRFYGLSVNSRRTPLRSS